MGSIYAHYDSILDDFCHGLSLVDSNPYRKEYRSDFSRKEAEDYITKVKCTIPEWVFNFEAGYSYGFYFRDMIMNTGCDTANAGGGGLVLFKKFIEELNMSANEELSK